MATHKIYSLEEMYAIEQSLRKTKNRRMVLFQKSGVHTSSSTEPSSTFSYMTNQARDAQTSKNHETFELGMQYEAKMRQERANTNKDYVDPFLASCETPLNEMDAIFMGSLDGFIHRNSQVPETKEGKIDSPFLTSTRIHSESLRPQWVKENKNKIKEKETKKEQGTFSSYNSPENEFNSNVSSKQAIKNVEGGSYTWDNINFVHDSSIWKNTSESKNLMPGRNETLFALPDPDPSQTLISVSPDKKEISIQTNSNQRGYASQTCSNSMKERTVREAGRSARYINVFRDTKDDSKGFNVRLLEGLLKGSKEK